MKLSINAFLLVIVAVGSSSSFTTSEAFTARARAHVSSMTATTTTTTTTSPSSSFLRMSSSAQDEVAKLRAAAAKAREEAAKLAKELGKDDTTITTTKAGAGTATVPERKSPDEVRAAIRAVDFLASAASQVDTLDRLRKDGYLSLYKSATEEVGCGDLRSYPVSLSMLEQRSGLTSETLGIGVEEVTLDDFKYGE